jgi:transcription antitermination protein NusB
MSTPTTPREAIEGAAPGPQDLARLLGLRVLHALQGETQGPLLADETPDPGEEAMDTLSPEQRERATNVAMRRLAVQALYAIDASSLPTPRAALDAMLSQVEGLTKEGQERVRELALGAYEHRVMGDAELARLSPEWSLHRMPGVDRAILRFAHFEMATLRTHPRIAINEAIELARWMSTDKSAGFVNAVLDKVMRRVMPEWEARAAQGH